MGDWARSQVGEVGEVSSALRRYTYNLSKHPIFVNV